MTPILVAATTGLFVALLGTPIAIRLFRAWGWGQRIREDGPQGHLEKMGTPTMGGIVIIGGWSWPTSRPGSGRRSHVRGWRCWRRRSAWGSWVPSTIC